MYRAYSLRIYPNLKQQERITKTFDGVRFVWNKMLGMQMERHENNKDAKFITQFGMDKLLPLMKKEDPWLKDAESTSLQRTNRDLHDAFMRFFDKKLSNGFPRFKRKKSYAKSYTSKRVGKKGIEILDNHHIKLPKLGSVYFRAGRLPQGKIVAVTVRINTRGQYYAQVLVDNEVKQYAKTGKKVGIDLGLKDLLITSDGLKYDVLRASAKLECKLRVWERKMARRQENAQKQIEWDKHEHPDFYRSLADFSRYQQARKTVAKIKQHISNRRLDYLHKLTTNLVKQNDVIVVEKLNVKGMMQNHRLARSIANSAWAKLVELLKYKCEWHNKQLIIVDPKNTSRICSNCKQKNHEFDNLSQNEWLQTREWTCPHCHKHHDRDINASINILNKGLATLA